MTTLYKARPERWPHVSQFVLCSLMPPIFLALIGAVDSKSEVQTISYKDIPERVKIIGKLGRPLGELVIVRGRWVDVSREKPGLPLFFVDQVDGKLLNPPAEFVEVQPVAGPDSVVRGMGEAWELRGVETGGFVGFSQEVLDEVFKNAPRGTPAPSGFLTRFYYVSAKRFDGRKR